MRRRDVLSLGLNVPLLHACGGGGQGSSEGPGGEQVVPTQIASDDWPTASPQSQGIAPQAMQTLLTGGAAISSLRGLLVVRNGLLVGEQYFGGAQSSDLLHIRSATKTISSLLIGQALQEGRLRDVDQPLSALLPAELRRVPTSQAGPVPLRRLLQMRGGLQWNEDAMLDTIFNAPDLTTLALNRQATGGTDWNYDSASSHLLSPILADAYGMDELAVAQRNLFEPLGIRQVAWERDATGSNHGSWGLQLRPRDLMKIAWMALDGGRWQGRSVVPAAWLDASFVSQAQLGSDGALANVGYGYLWWTGTLGGEAVVTALGFGGQLALLVPRKRLAITTAAVWNVAIAVGDANVRQIWSLLDSFIAAV
jgi:CubicO group peptidase (beta-lactamase class C family)